MTKQRINPISPPYTEAVQSSFDVVMPAGMPPLNIFRTIAKNPRVLSRMVRGALLDPGSITLSDRELVILRVCGICRAEYEWGVHVAAFSAKSGFNQSQIEATLCDEISLDLWSAKQISVLRMVDELHESAAISEASWSELSTHFSDEQLIELIMIVGLYHAVSFTVNAFKIENEPFAPQFPIKKA